MSSKWCFLDELGKGKKCSLEALELLFNLYAETVYQAAFYVLKDAALAEDITQETFLTAYQKLFQVKSPQKVKAWLVRIAINKAIDLSKKRKTFIPFNETIGKQKVGQDVETMVIHKETIRGVEEAILALPPIYHQIFYFRYYLQFTIPEIAASLDRPENEVKSHLKRIKRTATKHLKRQASLERRCGNESQR